MAKKKSKLRRIIWLLLLVWIILIGLAYSMSRNFQHTVVSLVKKQLDKQINTEIILPKDGIRLSFFTSFPSATLQLKNVLVYSPPTHRHFPDTLLYAGSIKLKMNLKTLLKGKADIHQLQLSNARLNIYYTNTGAHNFLIFKNTGKNAENDSLQLNIGQFNLSNTQICYTDMRQQMDINCFVQKGSMSGSFQSGNFDIEIKNTSKINYLKIGNTQLNGQELELKGRLVQQNQFFIIDGAQVLFSGIPATLSGKFGIHEAAPYELNASATGVNFQKLKNSELKQISAQLGIEPKKGILSLEINIKRVSPGAKPRIKSNYTIKNGQVYVNALQETFDDIYLQGTFNNGKYSNAISSVIQVDTTKFTFLGSKFKCKGVISNLHKPGINIYAFGNIDFKTVQKFIPDSLGLTLKGSCVVNNQISGYFPEGFKSIAKNWLNLNIHGPVTIKMLEYTHADVLQHPLILKGNLHFYGETLRADTLELETGLSALTLNGQITQWKGMVDEQRTKTIQLNIKGKNVALKDFQEPGKNKDETFIWPSKTKANINLQLGMLEIDQEVFENISGTFLYNPYLLQTKNLKLDCFNGTVLASGSIAKINNAVRLNWQITPKQLNVNQVFKYFNNFNQQNITHNNLKGNLGGDIQCALQLNANGKVEMSSLSLISSVQIDNGELINYKPLEALSKFIDIDELKHIKFDKLTTDLIIDDNVMHIDKTWVASSAVDFSVSGTHHFSKNFEYLFQVVLSDILMNKARRNKRNQTEFGYIRNTNTKKTFIPLLVYGNENTIEVKYDRKKSREQIKQNIADEKQEWKQIRADRKTGPEMVIEWENDTISNKPGPDTSPKPKNNEKTTNEEEPEFIIHWDDE